MVPRRARSARWPSRRTRTNGWRSRAAPPSPTSSSASSLRACRPDDVPGDPEGDPNQVDGEPAVRWRFACPARVRALWCCPLELAARVAGEPLADWRAVEVVAAEGSSAGLLAGASIGDRVLIQAMRLARRAGARRVTPARRDRLGPKRARSSPRPARLRRTDRLRRTRSSACSALGRRHRNRRDRRTSRRSTRAARCSPTPRCRPPTRSHSMRA